ncbi:hypothetical protein scyTo_0002164 [Scyliorhinus torazame]|uniref:Olfactomedin-like domain-containing protein n=1 Tax=Scyliorhinus torazame TaxID=75743 RepID=A0A401PI15_SCYTO|nr:hypothetical protein [Scyliorhinus torazame]
MPIVWEEPKGETEARTSTTESERQDSSILSELLGDYDKVKAVSEGSDCRCKCVLAPLGQDACHRIQEGTARPDDAFTVETISSGPHCKCTCLAPPSALNPCDGQTTLQKLREAENNSFKLSSVMELLEGAFFGIDLLKLHSVTTKLIKRIEKLEEAYTINTSTEDRPITGNSNKVQSKMEKKENCTDPRRSLKEEMIDMSTNFLQRDAAATYTQSEERHIRLLAEMFDKELSQKRSGNKDTKPLALSHMKEKQFERYHRHKHSQRPTILRATYYKAKASEEAEVADEDVAEDEQISSASGEDANVLFLDDQLIKHMEPAVNVSEAPYPALEPLTTINPETAGKARRQLNLTVLTEVPTAANITTATTTQTTATTTKRSPKTRTTSSAPIARRRPLVEIKRRQRVSHKPNNSYKTFGECKETLSTISGPKTKHIYGRNEGAWMKDPLAKGDKIYITNYYYGNTLVEFRNMENFKQGRWSNSYKLPYNWIGTGHVVYAGAFYYNRAFTRNIIKYDMKQRYVAAWTLLHDAVYNEATPWRWRGYSDIDFAVDENGLWVIYPAIDDVGSLQEVIIISRLNIVDLSIQKETTWRTGLRKNHYGNCFIVCGVLYAVDSYNNKHANISYAFDTHTNTQINPRLPFTNEYSYTTQIDYNPKERILYAWDNGHQVTYGITFAY